MEAMGAAAEGERATAKEEKRTVIEGLLVIRVLPGALARRAQKATL
jgi:hypothetical protein